MKKFWLRYVLPSFCFLTYFSAAGADSIWLESDESLLSPASAYAESKLSVGFVFGMFDYREPGLMRDSGPLSGLAVSYANGSSSLPLKIEVEAELLMGRTLYDGSTWGGTPLSTASSNTIMELRSLAGPFWGQQTAAGEVVLQPFAGFAARRLINKAAGSGSYLREIGYLSLPLGAKVSFMTESGWHLSFSGEYDVFLAGRVASHFDKSFSDAPKAINNQSQGYGYRASLEIEKKFQGWSILVEPYVQAWRIEDSDRFAFDGDGYVYEPKNTTDMYGLEFALTL